MHERKLCVVLKKRQITTQWRKVGNPEIWAKSSPPRSYRIISVKSNWMKFVIRWSQRRWRSDRWTKRPHHSWWSKSWWNCAGETLSPPTCPFRQIFFQGVLRNMVRWVRIRVRKGGKWEKRHVVREKKLWNANCSWFVVKFVVNCCKVMLKNAANSANSVEIRCNFACEENCCWLTVLICLNAVGNVEKMLQFCCRKLLLISCVNLCQIL